MPTSETDPKPADKSTEKDPQSAPPQQDKHIDRDGGQRQPSEVTNDKS